MGADFLRGGNALQQAGVSRAGRALADRFEAERQGRRTACAIRDAEGERARHAVEWWRSEHVEPMLAVYKKVASITPELELGEHRVTAVSFRPKSVDSTVHKLVREPGNVNGQDEVDELHVRLGSRLEIRRVRDWARRPRSTGYRAVHLHVRERDRMIEVQLRTFGQDAWANVVEAESRLSGVNYKAGEGHPAVLELFRAVADLMAAIELGESHPDLVERFAAAYPLAKSKLQTPRLRDLEP